MPIKVQVEVRSRRKLLGAMSDQELLQTLHAAIAASDDQRIALVENAAELWFGTAGWMGRYAAQFPDQTRYQSPPPAG